MLLLVYSLSLGLKTDWLLATDPLPDCSKQVKSYVGVCDGSMKYTHRPEVEGGEGFLLWLQRSFFQQIGLPSQGLFSLPSLWEGMGLIGKAPVLIVAETFPLCLPLAG